MCAKLSVIASVPNMTEAERKRPQLASPEVLTAICGHTGPNLGVDALTQALQAQMPDLRIRRVLTRGGWHRFGGIVDSAGERVATSIVRWAEEECGGDVEALVAEYIDAGYCVTQLAGKTHFFTAPRSEAPDDFVQIEIEELQERCCRPLVEPEWLPDSMEEFLAIGRQAAPASMRLFVTTGFWRCGSTWIGRASAN